MHLVAIRCFEGELGERAQQLAKVLGGTAYEARQRLVATPAVVRMFADRETAGEVANRLEHWGFEPLVMEPESAGWVRDQFEPKKFSFEDEWLGVKTREGESMQIPYVSIRVILHGQAIRTQVVETTTKVKKFSASRAVMSGGLMMRKSTSQTSRSTDEDLEAFVHVYSTAGPPVAFRESSVDFTALGDAMMPSRAQNLTVLVQQLRAAAPEAVFDDRLRRRSAQAQLLGPGLNPDEHLAIASALLAISHLAG